MRDSSISDGALVHLHTMKGLDKAIDSVHRELAHTERMIENEYVQAKRMFTIRTALFYAMDIVDAIRSRAAYRRNKRSERKYYESEGRGRRH